MIIKKNKNNQQRDAISPQQWQWQHGERDSKPGRSSDRENHLRAARCHQQAACQGKHWHLQSMRKMMMNNSFDLKRFASVKAWLLG